VTRFIGVPGPLPAGAHVGAQPAVASAEPLLNRNAEHYAEKLSVVDQGDDPQRWTIVPERDGLDDGPARIREVIERDRNELTREKQVDPATDPVDDYGFRSRLVLARPRRQGRTRPSVQHAGALRQYNRAISQ
jgi:hypothetical protein